MEDTVLRAGERNSDSGTSVVQFRIRSWLVCCIYFLRFILEEYTDVDFCVKVDYFHRFSVNLDLYKCWKRAPYHML